MPSLKFPASTNAHTLADWVEMKALVSADGNASRSDLESAMRTSPSIKPDQIDAIAAEVFNELETRARATDRGYPFEIDRSQLLALKIGAWRWQSAYLVCLCLTQFGHNSVKSVKAKPGRIFEQLSVEAVSRYIGGAGVRFGSPRAKADIPVSFRPAVKRLTELLAEGLGATGDPIDAAKDAGLDVVAWRAHPDGRPGKLIVFGACATGNDWKDKRGELPDRWHESWFQSPLAVPPVRAFFVPRTLDIDWARESRHAGMLFDRCRIAYWAPSVSVGAHGDGVAWAKAKLASLVP